ncbi:MAG TPA: segregation/condensation protein A [Terriglobales bacterium]|nr:segregation/condensation protein A [Terriglobales bacterium]
MLYRIQTELFEGPLDLLLHLVKKNEVAISDVPTAHITEQYLSYVEMMHKLSLDVAGEYLVMAATLLLIKSRTLLPSLEEEEPEEADPRGQLVQQLIDYQRYREAALALSERPLLNRDIFARDPLNELDPESPEAQPPDEPPRVRASLWDLLEAMRGVIQRAAPDPVHEVVLEKVSLRDRSRVVLEALRTTRRATFARLFDDATTRIEVIVTFLALLELIKMHAVVALQEQYLGEIVIELIADDVDKVSFESMDEYDHTARPDVEEEEEEEHGAAG